MTLSEFKAWFEGFTEGIEGAPTAKQFAKIKSRVAEIDGATITYPIYIDRYVYPQWPSYPSHYPSWSGGHYYGGAVGYSTSNAIGLQAGDAYVPPTWSGEDAMFALGKAEAVN